MKTTIASSVSAKKLKIELNEGGGFIPSLGVDGPEG